jgi:DNA segregation ATPase FtsK/SpoIIIE-like protein
MIGDFIHFFDPLWITFSVIWFELHHLTIWHFVYATVASVVSFVFAVNTSEETWQKFAWSIAGFALLLAQLGQNNFITDFKVWIALGTIISQIPFIVETAITIWNIIVEIFEFLLAGFIWICTTLFKLFQRLIWLIVTIGHLGVWFYYTGKNTIELIDLFVKVNFYKVIYKEKKTPEFLALRSYFEWFKNNWQAQNDAVNRDYNREWYMGKRFYYKDAEPSRTKKNNNQNSDQSSSNQKQSSYDYTHTKSKKEYEEAYEKYKRDNGYTNQQQQQNSNEKKYKDEYAQFYSSSYYVRLGVSSNATFEEIHKAYLALVQKYHPDKNPSQAKEFTEITQKLNEAHDYFKKQNRKSS